MFQDSPTICRKTDPSIHPSISSIHGPQSFPNPNHSLLSLPLSSLSHMTSPSFLLPDLNNDPNHDFNNYFNNAFNNDFNNNPWSAEPRDGVPCYVELQPVPLFFSREVKSVTPAWRYIYCFGPQCWERVVGSKAVAGGGCSDHCHGSTEMCCSCASPHLKFCESTITSLPLPLLPLYSLEVPLPLTL